MSLSATCNVIAAWPSRSLDEVILKMELGAGIGCPSMSSNLYKKTETLINHIKQAFCYEFQILSHTEDTLHSSATFLVQHVVVGVKPLYQLLGRDNWKSVLQQQIHK